MHFRRIMICCLTLLISSAALAQNTKDFVWPVDGAMMSGVIESVTAEGITLKEKGSVKKLGVDQLEKFRFGDEPSGLSKVRSDVKNGQFRQARQAISKIKPSGRDFVKADIDFYKAMIVAKLALLGEGDIKSAASTMNKFLDKHSDSIRYYDACKVMGDMAMNLGRFNAAAKFYGKLSAAKSSGVNARGNLLQGDALFLQNKASEALKKYQQATRSRDVTLKNLAMVGVAKCQAAAGSHRQAIQQIEKLIKENGSDDIELFARAHNALGFAHSQAGNSDAALESYLYTDLLFYNEPSQHAEALYHLTKLWSIANKPQEASRARTTLKERYAASLWAKK